MAFLVNDLAWIIPTAIAIIGGIFACGSWFANVNSDRASFKKFMGEVKEKLESIFDKMNSLDKKFDKIEPKEP